MTLAAGQKFGPYELLSPLGAGGMGEVWKACDERLSRTVAMKFSKAEFSERFEREARAVAALNHPHICQVYDVGQSYIVMEFIDGAPLKGPLPVEKVLEYAGQILDALDAAHRKKIVHRDLKPGNILVTKAGIKLLDFGLAQQQAEMLDDPNATVKRLTIAGEILGTPHYMPPEQLHGKETDARSDLFAFGCVLYELLTGQQAFQGASVASVIAAILEREPLTLNLTPPLERVIRKCLAKDPDDRFQTARDLKTALLWMGEAAPAAAPLRIAKPKPGRWPWVAAALTALLAALLLTRARTPAPLDLTQLRFTPVASEQSQRILAGWAPDGQRFAYSPRWRQGFHDLAQIRLQSLSGLPTDLLIGASEARKQLLAAPPRFTPDGTRILFGLGMSTIGGLQTLYTVGASGGVPEKLLGRTPNTRINAWDLSPDGQTLALIVTDTTNPLEDRSSIALSSPPGQPWRVLPDGPTSKLSLRRYQISYSPDGKQLMVLFVDAASQQPSEFWLYPAAGAGKAERIFSQFGPLGNQASFAWMPDSRHAVITPGRSGGAPLSLGDTRTSQLIPVTGNHTRYSSPAVSPQGRILLDEAVRNQDLVEIPVDGSPLQELMATPRDESSATWSPVRDEYFYFTNQRGRPEVWLGIPGRGAQRSVIDLQQLTGEELTQATYLAVSPDGERLGLTAGGRIWIVPVAGGVPLPLTAPGVQGTRVEWSPDGQWIVYAVAPTFRSNILYVIRMGSQEKPRELGEVLPGQLSLWSPDGKWITAETKEGLGLISPDGGTKRMLLPGGLAIGDQLGWAPDSQSLYLLRLINDEYELASLDIRTNRITTIRKLDGRQTFGAENYTRNPLRLSRDGKRLLVTRREVLSNLWLLEGLELPKPWWKRLW